MSFRLPAVWLAVVGVCLGTCHAQTVNPGRTTSVWTGARVPALSSTTRTSAKVGPVMPVQSSRTIVQNGPNAPVLQAPGPILTPQIYAPPMVPQAAAPNACQQCPQWDCWVVSSRGCSVKDAQCRAKCLQFAYFHSSRQAVRMDEQSFMQALDPSRPLVIYIHGGYYKFGDVLHEARQMQNWIRSGSGVAPQMICFTWPSSTAIPVVPVDVIVLGRASAIHGIFLADFINRLPPQQQVVMLGHSFGARCASATLHVLAGGVLEEAEIPAYGGIVPRRLRAVLLAPAIDHHWLNPGERYGLAAVSAEKILIMRNSADLLLAIYPLRCPFSDRALGHLGLDRCDRQKLNCLNSRVDEFDTARYSKFRHNSDGYYTSPELSRVMAPYLSFAPLPGQALAP